MRLIGIALCLLALQSLQACGDGAVQASPPAPELRIQRGLPVCQVAGQTLHGDLFQPPPGPHQRRALLFVHGGGWSAGSRLDYEPLARALAQHGYTGLSVDYRLAPTVRHPAHLEDVKCALRWLRSQAAAWEVDPQQVAVIGGSAGAHLAGLLAYTAEDPRFEGQGEPRQGSTRVAAAILHAGPHDLSVLEGLPADARGAVHALLGTASPSASQLREASPVHYLRQGAVPTLILHGQSDPLVPLDQAHRLAAALAQVQASHQLIVIPGAGHADFGTQPDTIGQALLTFLQIHLSAKPP